MSLSIPAKLICEGELGWEKLSYYFLQVVILNFKEDMKNTVALIVQSQLQRTPESYCEFQKN